MSESTVGGAFGVVVFKFQVFNGLRMKIRPKNGACRKQAN